MEDDKVTIRLSIIAGRNVQIERLLDRHQLDALKYLTMPESMRMELEFYPGIMEEWRSLREIAVRALEGISHQLVYDIGHYLSKELNKT